MDNLSHLRFCVCSGEVITTQYTVLFVYAQHKLYLRHNAQFKGANEGAHAPSPTIRYATELDNITTITSC